MCVGIDANRFRIGFPFDLLSLFIGIRLNPLQFFPHLPFDISGFPGSFRFVFSRDLFALGNHSQKDLLLNLLNIVDPFDLNIDQLNPKICGQFLVGFFQNHLGYLFPPHLNFFGGHRRIQVFLHH